MWIRKMTCPNHIGLDFTRKFLIFMVALPWDAFVASRTWTRQSAKVVHSRFLPPRAGHISLVGAGPGDPNLLTLQAMKLMQKADLVVADRLISKEILDLVDCEVKVANKYPGCAEKAQREIYKWVNEAYDAGKHVIRLKIGDPFLFGRGGEEVLYFRETHGVEVDVVPGVSASYAAPLVANIPLTHRGTANKVVISTGYGKDYGHVDAPVYDKDQTVVLLMAVGRLEELSQQMLRLGYPPSTPVAIIEKASTPQQRNTIDRLDNIAVTAKEAHVQPPATIVIGDVVNVLHNAPPTSQTELGAQPFLHNLPTTSQTELDIQKLLVNIPPTSDSQSGAQKVLHKIPLTSRTELVAQNMYGIISIASAVLISSFVVSSITMRTLCSPCIPSTMGAGPLLKG
eukprot:gnl/MRDRNA2_/MRDRNA2_96086_c0_seq1.p1 gnl/MRDRNA2_/MRDRNA2_96086_c0~~gnl/MRDRNA2_/MRDRNA2_96086_c0_seq1.p1  ORF type:complete len:398 (-),score=57.38 gnl/MRDRNA2_/MRDRNA2_96086_c0_seq1:655-1848(-)